MWFQNCCWCIRTLMRPWWTTKGTRQWKWRPGQCFPPQQWEQFIIIDGLRLCLWPPSASSVRYLGSGSGLWRKYCSWNLKSRFLFLLSDGRIRFRKPQKHMDPDPDPQQWFHLFSIVKFNHRYPFSVCLSMIRVFLSTCSPYFCFRNGPLAPLFHAVLPRSTSRHRELRE